MPMGGALGGAFRGESPLGGGPALTPGMCGISVLKRSELGWSGTVVLSLRVFYGQGFGAAMSAG